MKKQKRASVDITSTHLSPMIRKIPVRFDWERWRIFLTRWFLQGPLFLLCLVSFIGSVSAAAYQPGQLSEGERVAMTPQMGSIRIPFIENQGQIDSRAKFYAQTFGGTVFVTEEGYIIYSLPNYAEDASAAGVALYEEFIGGKAQTVIGKDSAVTRVNYFKGKDPSQWQRGLSTYNQVSLGEVYPGIHITLKAYGNNVEKLFVVQPGARPEMIRGRIDGARTLRVNHAGELEIETPLGNVNFTAPIAYQEINGQRHPVEVAYQIDGEIYGFTVGNYNPHVPLMIDPLLASTFLGGSDVDRGYDIAIDGDGNVFVSGSTRSTSFPTTSGAYDESFNMGQQGAHDVFISKFTRDLTSLTASTFLGGYGGEGGFSLMIDSSGNVYIAGDTTSPNFPTTSGAYDETYNGGLFDVFIAKLSNDLSTLLASTFVGGSGDDWLWSNSTVDAAGNIYITGQTYSSDFPTTPGAYDRVLAGDRDAFVAKFNNSLATLSASTFLGGSTFDMGADIHVDGSGAVHVTGETDSSDFPTTTGVYDESANGTRDVFVSIFDNTLSTLSASTLLGGTGEEGARSIDVKNGIIFITGLTGSSDFPVTSGAYDEIYNGGDYDAFISTLNNTLTTLSNSTFLGGGNTDAALSLLNENGTVYITGVTYSADFPTTPGVDDQTFNGAEDVIVAAFTDDLSTLTASTFLGGNGNDGWCLRVAMNSYQELYITGRTESSDFPTSTGAYDTSFNGNGDAFVVKFDRGLSTGPWIIGISPNSGPSAGGTAVTISGLNFGSTQGTGNVTFGGTPATSYTSWSNTQIVCETPAHAAGAVDVTVTADTGLSGTKFSAFTYIASISGYVRTAQSVGLPGVEMVLQGSPLAQNPVTDANGFYLAEDIELNGWSGTITPQKSGYGFDPASRTYTDLSESLTDQNYIETLLTPEISIKQGTTEIPSGSVSYDFGTVDVGADTTTIFTIENTGTADLTLTGEPKVAVSGTHAVDFMIAQQPSSPIGSGTSTTFEITFTPTDIGARTATVSIANNDADENPYTFTVTGTGQRISYLLWTK